MTQEKIIMLMGIFAIIELAFIVMQHSKIVKAKKTAENWKKQFKELIKTTSEEEKELIKTKQVLWDTRLERDRVQLELVNKYSDLEKIIVAQDREIQQLKKQLITKINEK